MFSDGIRSRVLKSGLHGLALILRDMIEYQERLMQNPCWSSRSRLQESLGRAFRSFSKSYQMGFSRAALHHALHNRRTTIDLLLRLCADPNTILTSIAKSFTQDQRPLAHPKPPYLPHPSLPSISFPRPSLPTLSSSPLSAVSMALLSFPAQLRSPLPPFPLLLLSACLYDPAHQVA